MDKYLEAINSEEDKLRKLNSKKTELTNVNRTRKEEIKKYKKDEKRLESEQDFNLERRDFLQNKKSYIKSFLLQH